jgi:serine/threonine protein kinase
MAIAPGTQLGRYEIRSLLGAGGMGEVYSAWDTHLDRTVALKVLHEEVARDAQRMRRFKQEAKAASALNHPYILTIHEIGETESAHFIATEFIQGETLRQRMQNGKLPLGEVLNITIQVADALSAAHVAGIVHRDVKPENVMIRPDGYVKVLDFGLAKLVERRPTDTLDTSAPTKALVNTEPGVVMGTTQYMSPEQARGYAVDERTDVWSLGVMLYEMVAGVAPFKGQTASDTIAGILKTEPKRLSSLGREVPAELERIVSKALEKEADERYQTSRDLLVDLRRLKKRMDFEAELGRSTHAPEATSRGTEQEAAQAIPSQQTAIIDAPPTREAQTPPPTPSASAIVNQIKQHKRGFALAALAVVIAAVGLGYWLLRSRPASAPPSPPPASSNSSPSNQSP